MEVTQKVTISFKPENYPTTKPLSATALGQMVLGEVSVCAEGDMATFVEELISKVRTTFKLKEDGKIKDLIDVRSLLVYPIKETTSIIIELKNKIVETYTEQDTPTKIELDRLLTTLTKLEGDAFWYGLDVTEEHFRNDGLADDWYLTKLEILNRDTSVPEEAKVRLKKAHVAMAYSNLYRSLGGVPINAYPDKYKSKSAEIFDVLVYENDGLGDVVGVIGLTELALSLKLEIFRKDTERAFVYLEGEEILATLSYATDSESMLFFWVKEEHRRKGIGTKLFHHVVNKYKPKHLNLFIRPNNEKALRFYTKLGMKSCGSVMTLKGEVND